MSRRLSIELWGELLFIQAISAFYLIFINMGIEFHGTKYISIRKERDKDAIGRYNYIKTINSLIILFIGSLLILFKILPLNIILFSTLFSISIAFSPSWIFLAEKNISPIVFIEITFKGAFLLFLYIFVQDDELGSFYLLFLSIANLFVAFCGYLYLFFKYKYSFFCKSDYLTNIKELSNLFLWQIAGIGPMMLPILMLGLFSDYRSVAIFGNADKLFKGIRALFSPALRLAIVFSPELNKGEGVLTKRVAIRIFFFSTIAIILLSLLSSQLITFLLGEKYYGSILFFKILTLALPFIWTYNFIIGAYVIPKNQEKSVTNINFIITVSSLIFIPIFIYLFDLTGLSTYVVLIEVLLFFRVCIIMRQAMLKRT